MYNIYIYLYEVGYGGGDMRSEEVGFGSPKISKKYKDGGKKN